MSDGSQRGKRIGRSSAKFTLVRVEPGGCRILYWVRGRFVPYILEIDQSRFRRVNRNRHVERLTTLNVGRNRLPRFRPYFAVFCDLDFVALDVDLHDSSSCQRTQKMRHSELKRSVGDIPGGVRTSTESDSPDLVAELQAKWASPCQGPAA